MTLTLVGVCKYVRKGFRDNYQDCYKSPNQKVFLNEIKRRIGIKIDKELSEYFSIPIGRVVVKLEMVPWETDLATL
jgi:hypothetical protein